MEKKERARTREGGGEGLREKMGMTERGRE